MFRKFSVSAIVLVAAVYLLLFSSLFFFLSWPNSIDMKRVGYSVLLSISTALFSTVISILIALPAAYSLSRYEFRGKNIIDLLLELPLIVSPLALGAIVVLFFDTPAGEWLSNHGLSPIYRISGILIAQFITIIGVAVRMVKQAFDSVPLYYENVARSLGANQFQVYRTISIPLAKKGILASFLICFAKSIGEFGATLMIAGSMPFKTETIPIGIFLSLSSVNITRAVFLIIIIIFIGLSSLMVSRYIAR